MWNVIRTGIAAMVALTFAAHFDSADAKKRKDSYDSWKHERDRYGFYAPYFGSDTDDRHRYRTERGGAYDKGARTGPPSRLERGAYSYDFY